MGSAKTFQVEGKTCRGPKGEGRTLTVREAAGLEGTGRVVWGRYGEDLAFNPEHCGKSLRGFGLC